LARVRGLMTAPSPSSTPRPFAHLVQVIRHGLKKIQYQPGLIEGRLAGTGLALDPD
jgi:hypothetical protein